MKPMMKGIAIALIHVAIVGSLGAKMLYDRAHCPRVWARTVSYDPNLPIRGRYITARLEVNYPGAPEPKKDEWYRDRVRLSVADGKLTATHDPKSNVDVERMFVPVLTPNAPPPNRIAGPIVVADSVAFFLPEHYEASRLNARGQEIWMEVTVPNQGPPRPLALAIKHGDGTWEPLQVR